MEFPTQADDEDAAIPRLKDGGTYTETVVVEEQPALEPMTVNVAGDVGTRE